MREIKYRGKAVMTKHELDYLDIPNYKGWIKGSLIVDWSDYYIVGPVIEASDDGLIHEWWAKVHPESVGQYIRENDENNVAMFEGDIVNLTYMVYAGHGTVDEVTEIVHIEDLTKLPFGPSTLGCEVIGNQFDNPELLEQHYDN